ncbi:macro domain protein [Lyngbya aestuarii BL J]|uniref:Macro domain protein n=1 Tax=Lyngbya aestuarii BL J TaxID=1348334 RepID=U7QAJ7_9CYAN|nr:macro domain-containing protein [Lyngbya aestuarii]ERT04848.1 macro domain protein [Lyngbya aestuarii BL J]
MLHYTDTTVFNVDVQTIVNTINCVGVMGAGLALEFQLRFPEMERDYVERCKKKEVKVGKPYLYRNYKRLWILNFPTKNHWRYPSKIEWIEEGLKYFATNYKRGGITSVAFPKLGCSNGGLAWADVSPLMEKYLQNLDIDVFICLDQEDEATGTEGAMVNLINNIESSGWDKEFNIKSDIRKKIIDALPIRRFRELGKIEGVGKQTYKDIFKLLYTIVSKYEIEKDKSSSANTLQLQTSDIISVEEKPQEPANQLSSQTEAIGISKEPSNANTLSSNENYDAFFIILPYLEKALSTERTQEEISEMFKLPKSLVNNWLKEAERLGKVKKLTHPVRYIAVSDQVHQQLEFKLAK